MGWLADYEAWGNTAKVVWREEKLEQLQVSADELQPIRFQGQSFDKETGLHYNRFPYFDPDLAMFTTRDPIGLLGGNNVFQYAPNPTGWIDPFGLNSLKKDDPARNPCSTGKWIKKPEIDNEKTYDSFVQARTRAKQLAGMNSHAVMPYHADMGPIIGTVTGWQTTDRLNHWRIDWDPNSDKKFHVNWRKIYKDKQGNCVIERGVLRVSGGEKAYQQQFDRLQAIASPLNP